MLDNETRMTDHIPDEDLVDAPSWWTLADASGNEADIATTMGRD